MGYKENFLRALEKAEKEVENSVTFESLENFIKENEFFVLWGASEGGKISKKIVSSYGGKVVAFVDIDSNKWNKELDGVKIYPPSQIESFVKKGAKILISSIFLAQIGDALTDMGFEFGKDFSVSTFLFEGVFRKYPIYGRKFFDYVSQNVEKFFSVVELLEDSASKETYLRALLHRIYGFNSNLTIKPIISEYPQYFHPKVLPQSGSIVIDGGAWPGNFIEKTLEFGIRPKKVYAIEPAKDSFLFLQDKFKDFDFVKVMNCALDSEQGIKVLHYTTIPGTNTLNYCMDNKIRELDEVETITLDSLCCSVDKFPLFIKLDIEGLELDVIKGGKRVFSELTPSFAIAVYHKPEDYWKIPLRLEELNGKYKFYIGHHSASISETVLYGVNS